MVRDAFNPDICAYPIDDPPDGGKTDSRKWTSLSNSSPRSHMTHSWAMEKRQTGTFPLRNTRTPPDLLVVN